MLEINNIKKTFDAVLALDDVSLNIASGEFFGLLGPNGAGKTTLLNIIIGFLLPDAGHISIDNEAIVYQNLDFRKRFGYVPQEIALYSELTALQNLRIFGSLYDLKREELNNRISEALELVELEDRKNDPVKNFSGGMKRRLNLAASILHDPEIILCDEPTVGVDPQSRNAIFEMLMDLNKKGKTIIYTTHYMEEAERLCNRLAIIDNGKIVAEGTLSELIKILDKKETIKLFKTNAVLQVSGKLQEVGMVNEFDDYYEIIPDKRFIKNSELFAELENMGVPNDSVELTRASLEDVFLQLTGRRLRD